MLWPVLVALSMLGYAYVVFDNWPESGGWWGWRFVVIFWPIAVGLFLVAVAIFGPGLWLSNRMRFP